MDDPAKSECVFKGIGASPGIAHGRAFVLAQSELEVPAYQVEPSQRASEVERFEQALLTTRQQILGVQREVRNSLGEDEARIFDAHLLVLEDQALIDETERELEETSMNIETCFRNVGHRYIDAFGKIDDEYLRERASDIRDVVERVLHNLAGRSIAKISELADQRIMFSRDITTSGSAGLGGSGILGLVTDAGGRTSHAVIMARSMGIPAVVGASDASTKVGHGDWVIVDGYDGLVIVNPSAQTLFKYGKLQKHREELLELVLEAAREPAETPDGHRLSLFANIESVTELKSSLDAGADGIGLFRTEYLFLQNDVFPSEDMQFEVYRQAAQFFGKKPVVIRTMDIGGDKPMKWAGFGNIPEANPFLGFRAIRFCLQNLSLFKDQLRAILRASAFGNVKLMFPMISGLEELQKALAVLEDAKADLEKKRVAFNPKMEVGSMIEIPGAALVGDLLAPHCDFFSIGTNDLIQYLLAIDRGNDRTSHLYEPTHPAVLRTLKQIFDIAHEAGIKASVCGEMAGDPVMVPLLLGLGADELSIAPSSLSIAKYLIQRTKIADARTLASEALREGDPKTIVRRATEFCEARLGEVGMGLIATGR